MKKIVLLAIVVFLFSACSKKDNRLFGYWTVTKVVYLDSVLVPIVLSDFDYSYSSMSIDKRMVLSIPNSIVPEQVGYFKIEENDDQRYLNIYSAEDKRFEGAYQIEITSDSVSTSTYTMITYYLLLKKEDMYIQAYREVKRK